jgi:hypothetical protein
MCTELGPTQCYSHDSESVLDDASPVRTIATTVAIVFRPSCTAHGFWPRHGFPRPRVPPSCSPITSASSTLKASPSHSPLCASPPHPCPPSTAAWTGRSGFHPRLPSPQWPPPKLAVAPWSLSRYALLPLRPATTGVPPPARAAVDVPYLVSSSICRFPLPRPQHPFSPSPFLLVQEHRKELRAATAPLLCPPRHPSLVRASLPVPFSIPRHWRLHPTSWVVSLPDWNHGRSSYARTAHATSEPIATLVRRCSCSA